MDSETFLTLIDGGQLEPVRAALRDNPCLLAANDRLGWTALHRAISHGDIPITRALIEAGVPVDAEDRRGETALFFAVFQDPALLDILLSAGADPNHRNSLGDTPLFLAGDADACEQAGRLLAGGADAAARNDLDQTALHAAAAGGSWRVVEALLAAGAEVNARDSQGKTALHWAISGNIMPHRLSGHLKAIELLLDAHADPALRTLNGESVVDLARRRWGFPEIYNLLVVRGVVADNPGD